MDHNVAEAVDASVKQLSDSEQFLSILASIRAPGSPTGLPSDLMPHVKFSVLTVADEQDMLDILQICSGMNIVIGETKSRHVLVTVMSGTLNQWRDSVVLGCGENQNPDLRTWMNQVHGLFVNAGLGDVWHCYNRKEVGDDTFLLTYER